ncbi:hypothetical protein R3P38DRAFT_3189161 [Favolaschia claudopus]|uniref:Uncharacterized protein n=1 Tax=Favolaschia claudopus TaxID=2862362 RepID=A0AAW0BUP9_9AGAR
MYPAASHSVPAFPHLRVHPHRHPYLSYARRPRLTSAPPLIASFLPPLHPSSAPIALRLHLLFLPHPTPPPSNDLLSSPRLPSPSTRSPDASYVVSPSAHIPPLVAG